MDALNHLVVVWGAILLMGLYDRRKSLYLISVMAIFTVINFFLADAGNFNYNYIGSAITYLLLVYLVYERYSSTTSSPSRNLELIIMMMLGNIVATFSHGADQLLLILGLTTETGLIDHQRDVWRPHNLWHTPGFGFIAAIMMVLPMYYLINQYATQKAKPRLAFTTPLIYLILAFFLTYFLHILGDTMTYEFPVFWFWPISDFSISYYATANNGITVSCPPENPDCYVYYYAMPIFAWTWLALGVLMKVISKSTSKSIKSEFT